MKCKECSNKSRKNHDVYVTCSYAMALLNDDRQVHPLMDDTVDVVRSRCGKWSDLYAIAVNLHIVDSGRTWLVRGFGRAILPRAIRKNVQHCYIVYEQEFRAFGNGDG